MQKLINEANKINIDINELNNKKLTWEYK